MSSFVRQYLHLRMMLRMLLHFASPDILSRSVVSVVAIRAVGAGALFAPVAAGTIYMRFFAVEVPGTLLVVLVRMLAAGEAKTRAWNERTDREVPCSSKRILR